MANNDSTPYDVILNEFDKWVKDKKKIEKAHYSSLNKAFRYLKQKGATEVECNFREILPKLIMKEGGKDDIKKLVDFIGCTICKYKWPKEKGNRLDNAKTYLTNFLNYIDETVSTRAFGTLKKKLQVFSEDLKISNSEEKMLENAFKNRIIYSHDELRNKIKSRLRTQNRTSGDKVWLPLTFIAKLYNSKGTKKENAFNDWLNTLVNNVYVHYLIDNKVKNAKFENEKLYLEFIKKEEETEFHVNVVLSKDAEKGECYPALTPTGKGNLKEEMIVRSIDAIAVDHVIAIDTTLKKLENSLPNLEKVSTAYKELQELDENDNNKISIIDGLRKDITLDEKDCLIEELNNISNDSPLRLMASKYNSQKSNGDTFQRIIIKSLRPKRYWGIIEEEEEIYNEEDKRGYYIQELSDSIKREDNKFRFVTDRLPSKENESKNITGREKLEEILNYI